MRRNDKKSATQHSASPVYTLPQADGITAERHSKVYRPSIERCVIFAGVERNISPAWTFLRRH
jgi:hypothetical protein